MTCWPIIVRILSSVSCGVSSCLLGSRYLSRHIHQFFVLNKTDLNCYNLTTLLGPRTEFDIHLKQYWCILTFYLELWKPGQQTFCNFFQLPLSNSLFTVLFAYVVFFFACFVVRDLCRSRWRKNYILPPPPPLLLLFFPTHNSFLTQKTVIWNQCAPKAGFGAV